MRVDPLVKETHIHYPTDSGLLGDGVRVLTLTMSRIVEIAGQTGVFFSSRRRHTRLVSDWSSDVCSSDLFLSLRLDGVRAVAPAHPPHGDFRRHAAQDGQARQDGARPPGAPAAPDEDVLPGAGASESPPRSEERRVGKECSSRGAPAT